MERFRGGVLDLSQAMVGGGGDLPPGFRFHPTDEELIGFYLLRKTLDTNFCGRAIAEIDLNKCEPWELPDKAKMGEKEWYFFSLRDRKYPTGLRTNRATVAGYWKATGKDREVRCGGALAGMKKTLVFYRGRAPKGQKTQWVMHEYRLEGSFAYHHHHHPASTREEWVIARVFQKPGQVPPARNKQNRLVAGLTSGDASCFSDSTSASVGGGCGGASASSAPRGPLQLPDASLFAAADAESGGGGSYLGYGNSGNAIASGSTNSNSNLVTERELVPCFSTSTAASMALDATLLGIGQYNPAPLAFEPPPANFFTSLRALQQQQDGNNQLPLFLTSGGGVSSALGGSAHHHWGATGMMDLVKVEGPMGRAPPPQMAVGPGQLDGAYAWGY